MSLFSNLNGLGDNTCVRLGFTARTGLFDNHRAELFRNITFQVFQVFMYFE